MLVMLVMLWDTQFSNTKGRGGASRMGRRRAKGNERVLSEAIPESVRGIGVGAVRTYEMGIRGKWKQIQITKPIFALRLEKL